MKPVNRNPPVRPTVPLDPPQPADVTHRPRSCHGGQNAHTRADNSRHVSHVTLRNTHTQTHTNIEFDVQLQRRTTAVLCLTVGRILRSDGKCERRQFDVHRRLARLQPSNHRVTPGQNPTSFRFLWKPPNTVRSERAA